MYHFHNFNKTHNILIMKKLLLSLTILTGMVFWACSDDKDPTDTNCVTCTKQGVDSFHLCNRNGQSVIDGVDTGGSYQTELNNAQTAGFTCS